MKGRPPLRSSRQSCNSRKYTWTADSPPPGTLPVDGEPVGEVTDFSWDVDSNTVYPDLESLYPETTGYLLSGTKKREGKE